MTREEALYWLDTIPTIGEQVDALEMAIKALEQEPILDKIKEEIKALSNANPSYWHSGYMLEREEVLDILDKYKAESEVQK